MCKPIKTSHSGNLEKNENENEDLNTDYHN